MPPGDEPSNLNAFLEPRFRAAVRRHAGVYHAHFGERLLAVYVWGSVHLGQRSPERSRLGRFRSGLARTYCGRRPRSSSGRGLVRKRANGDGRRVSASCRPRSSPSRKPAGRRSAPGRAAASARTVARALGFRLRYDATRVWGRELVSDAIVPRPDKKFARTAFPAARDLARFAAGRDARNKTDFDLPDAPLPRLRKLARLAVLGGGYLLMARGQLRSFKGADVLPALMGALPDWKLFLEQTASLYVWPPATAPEIADYLARLTLWMDWVDQSINDD